MAIGIWRDQLISIGVVTIGLSLALFFLLGFAFAMNFVKRQDKTLKMQLAEYKRLNNDMQEELLVLKDVMFESEDEDEEE